MMSFGDGENVFPINTMASVTITIGYRRVRRAQVVLKIEHLKSWLKHVVLLVREPAE